MKSFTVVISDTGKHDKGLRANPIFWSLASRYGAYAELGLYWFLVAYFGRQNVRLLRPSQLVGRTSKLETDWLFVGIPTHFGKEHLQNIKYRRLVLYDATDTDGLNFEYSDRELLTSVAECCLKNWRDKRWTEEFPIGLLPIKRPPLNNRLAAALQISKLKRRASRDHDVGFIARPTGSVETNERLRWMLELKEARPDVRLWGGLVGSQRMRDKVSAEVDPKLIDECWLGSKKVGFFKYFEGMQRSKVALAPRGYAPWSYRHFEAIYAGCVVVSNDLRNYEFLVPFPTAGVVAVGEGESVVPAVDRALNLYHDSPEIVDDNRAEIDRWLDGGHYSRNKTETIDRFFGQLKAA